jgi:hypothetical protein
MRAYKVAGKERKRQKYDCSECQALHDLIHLVRRHLRALVMSGALLQELVRTLKE